MDIEKELEAESSVRHASPRDQVRRLRMEYAVPASVLGHIEDHGEDLEQWGITKREVTAEREVPKAMRVPGGPTHVTVTETVYDNAVVVLRELTVAEIKSHSRLSTEESTEIAQVKSSLIRFGKMEVEDREYDLDKILNAGGFMLHQFLVAASNAVVYGGRSHQNYMIEMAEALTRGKAV